MIFHKLFIPLYLYYVAHAAFDIQVQKQENVLKITIIKNNKHYSLSEQKKTAKWLEKRKITDKNTNVFLKKFFKKISVF